MSLDESKFTKVMSQVAAALKADPHHRLLSWDHAWKHWNAFEKAPNGDESLAALNLAFYLASWGMYRGSSDLLFRDYKALVPIVSFLKSTAKNEPWEDCIFDAKRDPIKLAPRLRDLAEELSVALKKMLVRPGKTEVNVSDTLLSKILLNTLGCVPAFDTEVKAALRDILGCNYPMGNGFDLQRLQPTIELARRNVKLVQNGQALLHQETHERYPLTKVLDLYLWHHGFARPKAKK
ncbi:MAG: hypothetical protein H3C27_01460 [Opitutaceae bacterium]|nr:hypothetical protein [Opitutaceae bacterium]